MKAIRNAVCYSVGAIWLCTLVAASTDCDNGPSCRRVSLDTAFMARLVGGGCSVGRTVCQNQCTQPKTDCQTGMVCGGQVPGTLCPGGQGDPNGKTAVYNCASTKPWSRMCKLSGGTGTCSPTSTCECVGKVGNTYPCNPNPNPPKMVTGNVTCKNPKAT